MAQQPASYRIIETIRTGKGEAVVYPDLAAQLLAAQKVDSAQLSYDEYRRVWRASASILSFIGVPQAIQPAPVSLPNGGSFELLLLASGEIDWDQLSIVVPAGVSVSAYKRGAISGVVSETYRGGFAAGTPLSFNVTASAPSKIDPARIATWTLVVSTTGSQVVFTPPPAAIATPAARSFPEGVPTQFSENLAAFFSGGAAPLSYAVKNEDGSALTGYTLNSLTNGVATITSPASPAGAKNLRYEATDAQSRTAFVLASVTVQANPPPVVISTPPSFPNILISSSGFVDLDDATVFSDTETLTAALKNSDGTAPPAGYSYDAALNRLNYPTEAGAVVRSFRLDATETGPLARTVSTPAFTFGRVTAPVAIIDPAADVTFPENAATAQDINVRTALGTDANEDIVMPDGSALPARFTKTALGSGVFRITATYADNEILSTTVKYKGTLAGNPVETTPTEPGAPTFKSIHNPPVPPVISLSALNDAPITLQIAQLSDDANNLIEANSAVASAGTAVISADRKSITLTPLTGFTGAATVTYTLRAPDDTQPVVASATVTFSAVIAPYATQDILTSSVDGTAMPAVDLTQYFNGGSYPLDVASLEFADSATGQRTGKSLVLPGVGTFAISATGTMTFTPSASGYTGVTVAYVTAANVNGLYAQQAAKLTHTQTSSGTSQNPFPNTLDGKAIIGIGFNHFRAFQGEQIFYNEWLYLDTLKMGITLSGGSTKTASAMIADGSFDPQTGRVTLPPGAYWDGPRIRYIQTTGFPELMTGEWALKFRAGTGITLQNAAAIGFVEQGSPAGSLRYVRTFTSGDTGALNPRIQNNGVANADFYLDYLGLSSKEATPRAFTDEFKTYFAGSKVCRQMDGWEPDQAACFYADEVITDDDFYIYSESGAWGALSGANRFKRKGCMNPHLWFALAVEKGRSLHINTPLSLGFGSVEAEYFAVTPGSASTSAQVVAFEAAVAANIATIEADIYQQNYLLAQRYFDVMIAKAWPDYLRLAVEQGLEQWNSGKTRQNDVARAFAKAKGDTTGNLVAKGMGRLMAIYVRAWRDAKAVKKPLQNLACVLGCQGPDSNIASVAIAAYKAYTSQNPIASDLWISAAFYIGKYFDWAASSAGAGNPWNAADETTWANTLAAESNAGTLFQTFLNWSLNAANNSGRNLYANILFAEQHRDLCLAQGCNWYGGYEGGFEMVFSPVLLAALPTAKTVAYNFSRSNEGYQIIQRWISEWFTRMPQAVCMNYWEIDYQAATNPSWAEKTPLEMNVLVPNTMSAAWDEAKTSAPAGGGGGGGGGTYTEISKDFTVADTRSTLGAEGWSYVGSGHAVVSDADGYALRSATELDEASVALRPQSPLNANLELELDFKVDSNANLAFGRFFLKSTSTGHTVQIGVNSSGNMTVAAIGDKNTILATTAGVDFRTLVKHQIRIVYYIHATAGVVEVRRRSDNALLGSFSGNTNPLALANVNLDGFMERGRARLYHIKGVTP